MQISQMWINLLLALSIVSIKANIESLKDQNQVNKPGVHIVKCHANWCGYCKKFAPEYENLSNKYSDKAKFYELENEEPLAKEFNKKYSVSGFPTTLVFKDGQKIDEVVGADSEKLENIIKNNGQENNQKKIIQQEVASSGIVEVSSDNDIDKNGIAVIKFYSDSCTFCKPYASQFEEIANEFAGKAKFYSVNGSNLENLVKKYKIGGYPETLILKNGQRINLVSGANPDHVRNIIRQQINNKNKPALAQRKRLVKRRKRFFNNED